MIFYFIFNVAAATEIYTLSLHDALPICYEGSLTTPPCTEGVRWIVFANPLPASPAQLTTLADMLGPSSRPVQPSMSARDRKSTRLNSSHGYTSYAVFCLKKKSKKKYIDL